MHLTKRLHMLQDRYRRHKSQHRERASIHKEMVQIMCRILRRESREERKANAHR